MCWPAPSRPPVSTACGTPGSAYRCGSGHEGCGRSSNCPSNPPNCSHCEPPRNGSQNGSGRWPTMRAVVYSSPGEVTVADVPDPILQADTDAVVQIRLTGICGTDLHAISG